MHGYIYCDGTAGDFFTVGGELYIHNNYLRSSTDILYTYHIHI